MRDVVGGGFIGVNGGALSDPTADHRHQIDFVGDHERQSAPAALGRPHRRSGACRSGSRSRQHRSREPARPEGGSARPASESDDLGESHLFLRSVPLSIGCDTKFFPGWTVAGARAISGWASIMPHVHFHQSHSRIQPISAPCPGISWAAADFPCHPIISGANLRLIRG